MSQSTNNGFQIFQGTASESADKAQITVRKGGNLVLTRAAVDMLGEGATHVQLAYNETTGEVGIFHSAADADGSYLLREQKNSPSRLVGGKRFFQHYGLEVEKARTFDAKEFSKGVVGFQMRKETDEDTDAESSETPTAKKSKTSAKKTTKRSRDGCRHLQTWLGHRGDEPGPLSSAPSGRPARSRSHGCAGSRSPTSCDGSKRTREWSRSRPMTCGGRRLPISWTRVWMSSPFRSWPGMQTRR